MLLAMKGRQSEDVPRAMSSFEPALRWPSALEWPLSGDPVSADESGRFSPTTSSRPQTPEIRGKLVWEFLEEYRWEPRPFRSHWSVSSHN